MPEDSFDIFWHWMCAVNQMRPMLEHVNPDNYQCSAPTTHVAKCSKFRFHFQLFKDASPPHIKICKISWYAKVHWIDLSCKSCKLTRCYALRFPLALKHQGFMLCLPPCPTAPRCIQLAWAGHWWWSKLQNWLLSSRFPCLSWAKLCFSSTPRVVFPDGICNAKQGWNFGIVACSLIEDKKLNFDTGPVSRCLHTKSKCEGHGCALGPTRFRLTRTGLPLHHLWCGGLGILAFGWRSSWSISCFLGAGAATPSCQKCSESIWRNFQNTWDKEKPQLHKEKPQLYSYYTLTIL